MSDRHVTHLLTRYVHGQLGPGLQARVVNHVATCNRCRTALAREEQIARDLWRELPVIGRETPDPVGAIWSGVWQEITRPRRRTRWLASVLLPGVSIALAIVLAVAAVLPLLAEDGLRAEAAPLQPRPISTASPTPGVTTTDEALKLARGNGLLLPQATVAMALQVGASPVPMPVVTVSPEARGAVWH